MQIEFLLIMIERFRNAPFRNISQIYLKLEHLWLYNNIESTDIFNGVCIASTTVKRLKLFVAQMFVEYGTKSGEFHKT